MKRLPLFMSLVVVMIALPLAARSQRVDSPQRHVLEFGGKQAVLAGGVRTMTSGTGIAARQTYSADLPVASTALFLSEFFSAESPAPRSGRIYSLAGDGTVQTVRSFANASFTEVRFPEMNSRRSSAGRVTAQFAGDVVRSASTLGRIDARAPADWQSNAYGVEIGSLPCGSVSRVEAFTVQRALATPVGATRTARTTSQMEVSNIVLTMALRDVDAWQDWFREFLVEGNTDAELSGSIEYLDASLRNVILTVELSGLGVVSLQPNPVEADHEEIATFTVTLSVRSVRVR